MLKYLVRLKTFTLILSRLSNDEHLLYAVQVDDDPNHPGVLWSIVETLNELEALQMFVDLGKCDVFLFNEGAINVCSASITFELDKRNASALIAEPKLSPSKNREHNDAVDNALSAIHIGNYENAITTKPVSMCNWNPIVNYYVTNQIDESVLDLINGNEGDQQETLAVWLTDVLSFQGAVKNPLIHEEKTTRELTDILLSYFRGTFLIESKTLSVLERNELPNRQRLKKNVLKNISKAITQLPGACRNIRRGLKITNSKGDEVQVERTLPIHCIVLVPDLSLLDSSDGLGGTFIKKFWDDSQAYLHILDPVGLLRSVQHALFFAKESEHGLPPIMTFDYALIRRWEIAMRGTTPDFAFLLRRN